MLHYIIIRSFLHTVYHIIITHSSIQFITSSLHIPPYSLLHHHYIIPPYSITSSLHHSSIQFITSSLHHSSIQFISNTHDISTCPSYGEIFSGINLNTLSVGFIRQCVFNQGINFIRQYDVYRYVWNQFMLQSRSKNYIAVGIAFSLSLLVHS